MPCNVKLAPGMLNEVWVVGLCFNYSYSKMNAGNSIFLCKSAKKVNSRWCIVHSGGCGGGPPATCHWNQWAGERVGQWSFSDAIKMKWHQPWNCYRRINCDGQWAQVVWRHIITSGRCQLLRTTWPSTTASQGKTAANALPYLSGLCCRHHVLCRYNYWRLSGLFLFSNRQSCKQIAYPPAAGACWVSRINCM